MKAKPMKPLLLITLLGATSVALAQQTNSGLPMPKRFEGIRLGMSMEELVKLRPQVTSVWHKTPEGKVDLTRTNETLNEFYRGFDPEWGELGSTNDLDIAGAVGNYEFRDGKLRKFNFAWFGDVEKITKHQNEFLSSCVRLWDNSYERHAITVERGSEFEQVVPVLLWKKGDTAIALVCGGRWQVGKPLGFFSLNVFPTRDSSILALYECEKFDPEVINKLFEGIGTKP